MSTNMSIHTSANNEELAEASNMPYTSSNIPQTSSNAIPMPENYFKDVKGDQKPSRLQGRLDAVYNSMLSILQNDPMGYQYEDFDESGFILLSTTCGVVDCDHYINCDLDGGEVAEFYPEWEELYKEYHKITLEAEQLNINLVFGK